MAKNKFTDYEGFVEKFKPKNTTDDCYTPEWCYKAVLEWVDANVLKIGGVEVLRPFWPGGDYQAYDYKPGQVVIDNPPFSIISQICNWYDDHGIKFFLFAPTLTLGGIAKDKFCAVICGTSVNYENGANVSTSFITNLVPNCRIWVAGDLTAILKEGDRKNRKESTVRLPVYEFPDGVVSTSRLYKLALAGQILKISGKDCRFVRALESQRKQKKAIYGAGWLLSREAAAREAAAREAIYWPLSEAEQAIMDSLG